MSLTTVQLDALKAFLTADAHGLGLAPLLAAGNHGGVATIMNTVNAGGWAQVDNEPVTAAQIEQQITEADLANMTLDQKQSLTTLAALTNSFSLSTINTMDKLKSCFPANGQTATNLQTLSKRQGRPGEFLFGNGVLLSANDISNAMARPQP